VRYSALKTYDDMLSRFHLIAERTGQRDRRTDRGTDGHNCYVSKKDKEHADCVSGYFYVRWLRARRNARTDTL